MNDGRLIPQLFLDNIQTLRFNHITWGDTTGISLERYPALRHLIFEFGTCPVEIFGSDVRKDWSLYVVDDKDRKLLEFGYKSVVSGDWTRSLFEDKKGHDK